jgi:hypothetical protein
MNTMVISKLIKTVFTAGVLAPVLLRISFDSPCAKLKAQGMRPKDIADARHRLHECVSGAVNWRPAMAATPSAPT